MVALLLLTLLQATPPAPAQPATQPPPAATTQKPRPRPAGGVTTTALLFITDPAGRAIENVRVNVMGPVDREVTSPSIGATRVEGLRAGTYRVRFTHEKFITFEKELSWRAGTAQPEVPVTLNPAPVVEAPAAPAPAPPVAAPPPATLKLPAPSAPKTVSLPDYIEKNFISGREPQKQNEIGCSGVEQALLWQVREPWNGRQHDTSDGMLYVVGGEGRMKLGEKEYTISAGAFILVPRNMTYSLSRTGRNPLIVLAVLAGTPCAAD